MASFSSSPSSARSQQGATLIVALVILAVVTILGLASMRSSNQQLLMSASARDRAIAFQRAEEALVLAEQIIAGAPPPFQSFNDECNGGLCFAGEFDMQTPREQCRLKAEGVTASPWNLQDLFSSAPEDDDVAFTRSVAVGENVTVPYVVEFMCFVPSGRRATTGGSGGAVQQSADEVPLYRITVRATGDAQRATVMLQSVYRAAQ